MISQPGGLLWVLLNFLYVCFSYSDFVCHYFVHLTQCLSHLLFVTSIVRLLETWLTYWCTMHGEVPPIASNESLSPALTCPEVLFNQMWVYGCTRSCFVPLPVTTLRTPSQPENPNLAGWSDNMMLDSRDNVEIYSVTRNCSTIYFYFMNLIIYIYLSSTGRTWKT